MSGRWRSSFRIQDIVAVLANEQGLRGPAGRGPGLDERIKILLRVGPQDEHGGRAVSRAQDWRRHVQANAFADGTMEEIADYDATRGDGLRN